MPLKPSAVIKDTPYISWYRDFFTKDECNYLLQIKEYTYARRKVDDYGSAIRDPHFTDSYSQTINIEQLLYLDIPGKFKKWFDLESITQLDSPSVVQYPIDGYIVPHVDGGPIGDVTKRHKTFILYLNDDYTGGDLKFNRLNVVVRPKTGCGVYFEYPDLDTNNLLLHESTPNQGCPKYCIPFFIRRPEYIEWCREEWIKRYGQEITKIPYF